MLDGDFWQGSFGLIVGPNDPAAQDQTIAVTYDFGSSSSADTSPPGTFSPPVQTVPGKPTWIPPIGVYPLVKNKIDNSEWWWNGSIWILFPSNPMIALGDMIYAVDVVGTPGRLGIGFTNQVLTVVGGVPVWAAPAWVNPMTSKGDMIYASDNTGTAARLPAGSTGQVVTMSAGLPSWGAAGMVNPMTTAGDLIYSSDGSGTPTRRALGTKNQILTAVGGLPMWSAFGTGTQITKSLAADVTTTSSTMANVGALAFAIGTSEIWTAEFNLLCTGTLAGMTFQLTGPASPTTVAIFTLGDTTGVTGISSDNQTAYSTPTQAYMLGAFTGMVTIKCLIINGTTAGTVQLQFAAAVNTQTEKVLTGSYLVARLSS